MAIHYEFLIKADQLARSFDINPDNAGLFYQIIGKTPHNNSSDNSTVLLQKKCMFENWNYAHNESFKLTVISEYIHSRERLASMDRLTTMTNFHEYIFTLGEV